MEFRSEVLFIGGRSGVGKSSVGNEIHTQLSAHGVRHCFIEGDNLDMGYPPPWEHGLAERNLSAMWRNYTSIGYSRLIYTNTASVRVIDELVAAMGDDPQVTAVLLSATNATARERLGRREIGSALDWHVERSNQVAEELDDLTPDWVHRVKTDDRSFADISQEVSGLTGWADPPQDSA